MEQAVRQLEPAREAMRQPEQDVTQLEVRVREPEAHKLSVSELLEKTSNSRLETKKHKVTVSDLLNRKRPGNEKGLNKDQDGIER